MVLEIAARGCRIDSRRCTVITLRERAVAAGSEAASGEIAALGMTLRQTAHDINNVLTGVMAGASLLRKIVADDPESVEFVEEIERAAERGAAITARALDCGRRATHGADPGVIR